MSGVKSQVETYAKHPKDAFETKERIESILLFIIKKIVETSSKMVGFHSYQF